MKTYYKVLNDHSSVNSQICLRYSKGVTKTPTIAGSKLFVFNSRQHAEDFANVQWQQTTIWECTITGKSHVVELEPIESTRKSMTEYWKAYAHAKKRKINTFDYISDHVDCQYRYWPIGTVWCDSVTLTKQIK